MKIFLGSILLAVALAAPIKVEDDGTPAAISSDSVEATTEHVVEEVTTIDPKEQIARENLRSTGIPEEGVNEFFAHGFYGLRSFKYEKYTRFKAWARKWQIKVLEDMSYEDIIRHEGLIDEEAVKTTVVDDATAEATTTVDNEAKGAPEQSPTLETTTETITDVPSAVGMSDEEREAAVRVEFRRINVPEEAIDDFIAQKFHTTSFNFDKYFRLKEWARKWNVERIATLSYNDIVSDHGMIDEEENPTVDAQSTEIVTVIPEKAKEETIRQKLHDMGLPSEAIDEFFAEGFQHLDFDDENVDKSRFLEWCLKWGHVLEERIQSTDIDKANKLKIMGEEILAETTHIFSRTFHAVILMQELAEVGDNITIGEYKAAMETLNNLSDFEKKMIEMVVKRVAEKTAAKHGIIQISQDSLY